jgi:hypothetical protein
MFPVSGAKPDSLPPSGKLLPFGQFARSRERKCSAASLQATSRKGSLFVPESRGPVDFGLAGVIRPREPNLPPIDEFPPRASTESHMGASAHRALQVHGIAELAHLSGPIHNEFVDPPLDASLPAA